MNRAERRKQERINRTMSSPTMRREIAREAACRGQQQRQREAGLPMDDGQVLDLVLYANEAAAHLTSGKAIESDLHSLACLSNVSLLLAEKGLGDEYLNDIKAGQQAIVSMFQRFERTGKVGASGPELQQVRTLVQIHEAQIEAKPTRAEMITAIKAIKHRMTHGQVLEVETC